LQFIKRRAGDYTIHGFRSSFRDWIAETTDFPNELAELALAHAIGNQVEAAYRRGDQLVKRRALMAAWGSYCCESTVVPFRAAV
jgi:integrase